jgi:hypothetical protein
MIKRKTFFEQVPVQIAKKAAELEPKQQKSLKPSRAPKSRGFYSGGMPLTQSL